MIGWSLEVLGQSQLLSVSGVVFVVIDKGKLPLTLATLYAPPPAP